MTRCIPVFRAAVKRRTIVPGIPKINVCDGSMKVVGRAKRIRPMDTQTAGQATRSFYTRARASEATCVSFEETSPFAITLRQGRASRRCGAALRLGRLDRTSTLPPRRPPRLPLLRDHVSAGVASADDVPLPTTNLHPHLKSAPDQSSEMSRGLFQWRHELRKDARVEGSAKSCYAELPPFWRSLAAMISRSFWFVSL